MKALGVEFRVEQTDGLPDGMSGYMSPLYTRKGGLKTDRNDATLRAHHVRTPLAVGSMIVLELRQRIPTPSASPPAWRFLHDVSAVYGYATAPGQAAPLRSAILDQLVWMYYDKPYY